VKYRMNIVIQIGLPESAHPLSQIAGNTGILETVAMLAQPQQLVSYQQKIQCEGQEQQNCFGG